MRFVAELVAALVAGRVTPFMGQVARAGSAATRLAGLAGLLARLAARARPDLDIREAAVVVAVRALPCPAKVATEESLAAAAAVVGLPQTATQRRREAQERAARSG
jgi:hypothetical protein